MRPRLTYPRRKPEANRHARAVVRVVAVDQDGQVHFAVLPGSLEKNRHLIGHALARTLAANWADSAVAERHLRSYQR